MRETRSLRRSIQVKRVGSKCWKMLEMLEKKATFLKMSAEKV